MIHPDPKKRISNEDVISRVQYHYSNQDSSAQNLLSEEMR